MLRLGKRILMTTILVFVAVLCVKQRSTFLFFVFILLHFLMLKITPELKHRENMGMFVTVAFSFIPINLELFRRLTDIGLFADSILVISFLRGFLYYIILLSVEEVIMGILTRFIWKNQYQFLPK